MTAAEAITDHSSTGAEIMSFDTTTAFLRMMAAFCGKRHKEAAELLGELLNSHLLPEVMDLDGIIEAEDCLAIGNLPVAEKAFLTAAAAAEARYADQGTHDEFAVWTGAPVIGTIFAASDAMVLTKGDTIELEPPELEDEEPKPTKTPPSEVGVDFSGIDLTKLRPEDLLPWGGKDQEFAGSDDEVGKSNDDPSRPD
jgi:hypothetical protein